MRNTCHGRDERGDDYRTILRNLVPPRFLRQEESRGVRMGPDGTDGKTRTKREFLSSRSLTSSSSHLFLFSDRSPYVSPPANYSRFILVTCVLLLQIAMVESRKSKVIPEEVDNRRSLFWELLYLDARLVSPTAARGYGAHGSPTNSRYRSADHLHYLSIIWTVPGHPTRRTRFVISPPALTIVS